MLEDLRTLTWLQWKRFKSNAAYWLTLIGFVPGANRFYLVYVALFWGFWLYTVWVFAVEQMYQISLALPRAAALQWRAGIPTLIFLLQVIYLVMVLRDSPLKLGAAEIEHVAVSPARRGAVVLVDFARSVLLPALFAGIAGCLLAMLLTWQSAPNAAGFAGLQGLVLGVPLFVFSAAVAWIAAVLKASFRSRWTRLAIWLVLPAVIALAAALPQLTLFPGYLWLTTVDATLTIGAFFSLVALMCGACGLLVIAGNRVNMAAVADDSRMYARIQKLGVFARLYADDVISSVRRQSHLVRKRHLRLSMSEQGSGYSVIVNRALLSLFRLAPSSLLRLVMRGIALAGTFSLLVRLGGWQHLQTWLLLLMILIQFRPTELNTLFQQDVGQAFTRQFLPANPLGIAIADCVFPIALMSFGGITALLIQPLMAPLTTVALVVGIVFALTLCQVLELVTVPRLFVPRIPYTYSVVLCGAALIAAGYLLKTALAVAAAALGIDLLLGALLYLSLV